MIGKRILFGNFEFPRLNGLEYLLDEEKPETDYLFVNEPNESFSMYFEKDFPIFTVPDNSERDYCLFELKRESRVIKFFCPAKRKNLDTAVWYFYMDVFDKQGRTHTLPGQVRVVFDGDILRHVNSRPKFIEVLEKISLVQATDT